MLIAEAEWKGDKETIEMLAAIWDEQSSKSSRVCYFPQPTCSPTSSSLSTSQETFITDLPKGSRVHNLAGLATFDEDKLPEIHELGEGIVWKFQQIMLCEWKQEKMAVIPDDLAQKLLVGVSFI